MFVVGKIDEDTVNCPRFFAFECVSRKHSSSSFNPGQLTKRIHGDSDEFDDEEAQQAQRKDRRRHAPFYLESPIGFTFTWNRPLCAVLMLLGGGGGCQSKHDEDWCVGNLLLDWSENGEWRRTHRQADGSKYPVRIAKTLFTRILCAHSPTRLYHRAKTVTGQEHNALKEWSKRMPPKT